MKKVLVAVLAGLISFGAGLFGFFYVMPSIAPERTRVAEIYLDSLRVADSLAQVAAASAVETPLAAGPAPDSMAVPGDSLPSVAASVEEGPAASASPGADVVIGDSLRALMERVNTLSAENAALRRQVQQSPAAQWGGAAALSGTLTKLDDKELRAILQQLDADVLQQLYLNSSNKNQTRLLESMPADKAAAFVQNLMKGSALQAGSTGNATAAREPGTALR